MKKINKNNVRGGVSLDKILKCLKENKRKAGVTVVLIMAVFVVLLNTSFGYFKKRIEGTKLTFNVGTLSVQLECINLNNCEVTIPPKTSTTVNVNVKSLNAVDSRYGLYYENVTSTDEITIEGGHMITDNFTSIGDIDANETKNITLALNNMGTQSTTIRLGVAPSLKNNEADLEENQISLNQISYERFYTFDYNGNYETFVAPATGGYKIELWGASGGNISSYAGGKGAYTSGVVQLEKDYPIHVYIGGAGSNADVGGYNGGGSLTSGQRAFGSSGGGATDVRLMDGAWNNFDSLKSRIMVAAGGGGANFRSQSYGEGNGGAGGTLTGINGTTVNCNNGYGCGYGKGGTQTSGGTIAWTPGTGDSSGSALAPGLFGIGGGIENNNMTAQSGGGSGYYGGCASSHGGAGGGSSFISGYDGCDAISKDSTSSNIIHTGESKHYSEKLFNDSVMIAGTNEMPTHDLLSTMTGNSGNGYARITLVSDGEGTGYIISSSDKDGYYYEIPANSSKEINLSLINTNEESSYYELFYEIVTPASTTNTIEGGYLSSSQDKAKELVEAGETKKVSLMINNTGSDTVYLRIDAKKYETSDESNLEKNEITLNNKVNKKFYVFDYTEDYETFVAPEDGYYKLEGWGAQGGTTSTSAIGGKGAYTSGIVKLNKNEEIYVYVGGQGGATAISTLQTIAGGYNGGGSTGGQGCCNRSYGSGGGATDFRLKDGTWNNTASLASRIMVAAGGGGAFQGSNYEVIYNNGGYGGALIGGNGIQGSNPNDEYCYGEGATQTSGGLVTSNCTFNSTYTPTTPTGSFGIGGSSSESTTGGGGGYYGGSRSGHIASAGGGSSYISGYLGCVAITSESNTSPKEGCSDGTTDISCSYHYSNKIFSSSVMKSGNEEVPTHDLMSTMAGNTGNGYARITFVGNATYTIVYNSNGGKGTMEDAEVLDKYPYNLNKNTFTKEGYGFVGWSLSPDSDEVVYKDMESVVGLAKKGETVNLYAVWADAIIVTFNANGGELDTTSKIFPTGYAYGTLPIPTKKDMTFDGWFTSIDGGDLITEETVITIGGNQTLYAHWHHEHVGQSGLSYANGCYTVAEAYGGSCGGHYWAKYYYTCGRCGQYLGSGTTCTNNVCAKDKGVVGHVESSGTNYHSSPSGCDRWTYQYRYVLGCGYE